LKNFERKSLVDALVISNSIGPGLRINVKTGKPYLESIVGGMSGKAIKPLILAVIYELKKILKIPIIGCGGIENADDVLEYIMLGCEAVQIYTKAHLDGLQIFDSIKNELIKKLNGKKLKEVKGTFWQNI